LGSYFLIIDYYFLTGAAYFYFDIPLFVLNLNVNSPCLLLSFLYFSGTRGRDICPVSLKSYKLALI
jgi:hypothetical protein